MVEKSFAEAWNEMAASVNSGQISSSTGGMISEVPIVSNDPTASSPTNQFSTKWSELTAKAVTTPQEKLFGKASPTDKYKARYKRSFSVTVEGRAESIPLTNNLRDITILKDFENASFPVIRVNFDLHDSELALLAGVSSEKLKFNLSITGFKGTSEETTLVEKEEDGLYFGLVLEANEFPKLVNKARFPETGYDEGAEYKTPASDADKDTKENLSIESITPISIFLFSPYDGNRDLKSGSFRASLTDITGMLLSDIKGATRSIIGKFADHCNTVIDTVMIPPEPPISAIKYIANEFGLYPHGIRIFKDFSSFFMCDAVNPPEADVNRLVIEFVDELREEAEVCYDEGDVHVIRVTVSPKMPPPSKTQGIRNLIGDKVKIITGITGKLDSMVCVDLSSYLSKIPGVNFLGAQASLQGVKTRYFTSKRNNPCIATAEIVKILTMNRLKLVFNSADINKLRCVSLINLRSLTNSYVVDETQEWLIASVELYFPYDKGAASIAMTIYPRISVDNSKDS